MYVVYAVTVQIIKIAIMRIKNGYFNIYRLSYTIGRLVNNSTIHV